MKYLLVIAIMFIGFAGFSQSKQKGTVTSTIKVSVQCEDCKNRIENKLNYTKGIKYADVDYVNKTVEVKYNPRKISLDEIKVLITKVGYNADDLKADPEAFENLPACCKPGGMGH